MEHSPRSRYARIDRKIDEASNRWRRTGRERQPLARNAELVPVHACEMMFQLLELIGMRSELGGSVNASGDATTN
jgi:hypothetical protein